MAIEVVFFDVGETLVDETRAWAQRAAEVGMTELTLFGALGALIERGKIIEASGSFWMSSPRSARST